MMSSGEDIQSLVSAPPIVAPVTQAAASPPEAAETNSKANSAQDDINEDLRILNEAYGEIRSHALTIEKVAMELDRAGDVEQAIACYKQSADQYKSAASACPDGNADKAVLARRAGQILGRVVYLETLAGAKAALPPEEHILPEDSVDSKGDNNASSANGAEAVGWKERLRQTGSAAAVAGTAGLLVLHAPVVAVVAAAGTAYATTRKDGAGEAARAMGDAGITAAAKAQQISDENKVPEKVRESLASVKEVVDKYGVPEKLEAAKASSWKAMQEFDNKHDVSSKVATGFASATKGATSATAKLVGWVAQARASR